MRPERTALKVIATHIEHCLEEVRSFYTLTFNPPHTYQMDSTTSVSRWIVLP
jgi:hypothetical protein